MPFPILQPIIYLPNPLFPPLFHHPSSHELRITSLTLLESSLLKSCSSKCIDPTYREADLNKGESVCLDRCVSKFFEVNVKVSEKMQGEAQGRAGGGGGSMFGM